MRFMFYIAIISLCALNISCKEIEKKILPHKNLSETTKVSTKNPPLVLVIMVKNEAHVIEKTLEPFLKNKVPVVLLDTGSTDDTVKITRDLFKKYNDKTSVVAQQPFVDFSASRNYALECAEKHFPNAGFFLMIDADWYVQKVPQLASYCSQHCNDEVDAFGIRICYNNSEYYVKRLLKGDKKVRFVRPIHESVQVTSSKRLPDTFYIKWEDSELGYEKSKARWTRDKEILLKEVKKNPNDVLNLFYLAQTYGDLHEYDNAIIWYKKVLELKGNYDDEKLTSCYRIACIYDHLQNWPLALTYYLHAYNLNPARAESLTNIAQHYLKTGEYGTSFLFAQEACKIPYPKDAYWKDKDAYHYKRYDILAAVAWPLHHYEAGEKALKAALEHNPNDAHLLKNLKVYQDRKKPKDIKK